MCTCAPALLSALATSRPIPDPAPVTTADLPVRSKGIRSPTYSLDPDPRRRHSSTRIRSRVLTNSARSNQVTSSQNHPLSLSSSLVESSFPMPLTRRPWRDTRYLCEAANPINLYRPVVVRFVCVIGVPVCARVSRVSCVCPGSPRCLFTGVTDVTGTSVLYATPRAARVCVFSFSHENVNLWPREARDGALRDAMRRCLVVASAAALCTCVLRRSSGT